MGAIKAKKRQKMCYNCEGEVDLDVIVCPFCAADLRAERPDQVKGVYSPSIHSVKHLNSSGNSEDEGNKPWISPLQGQISLSEEEPSFHQKIEVGSASDEGEGGSWVKEAVPVGLLTLGTIFCVLGLLLGLFSEDGVLILKWNAGLWFVYALLGLAFWVVGYRLIKEN